LLLSLCLVGAAFAVEARWGWVGVAPATFLQFGSTVSIGVVLYFLQHRFMREVRVENRALEGRFEARATELESRLDRLTDATARAVAARHESQDAAVARLDEDVSYESVTAALAEAARLNAVDPALFRVRASTDPGGLRVSLAWVEMASDTDTRSELRVELWSPDPATTAAVSRRWLAWPPDLSAAEVGDSIVLALEREGLPAGQIFDWGHAMAELQRSLGLAISARRGDAAALRLQGRLVERVDDDWLLTDAGIECPARSFLLGEEEFPGPVYPKGQLPPLHALSGGPDPDNAPPFRPDPPQWVSAEVWDDLLSLGRHIYPIAPRSFMFDSGWRQRPRRSRPAGDADGGPRGAAS